jgi:hypothetical protein
MAVPATAVKELEKESKKMEPTGDVSVQKAVD